MKLLIVTEGHSGGEAKATQSLANALREVNVDIELFSLEPLQKTGLFRYLFWIVRSVIQASRISWRHRDVKVFYTTTYTALLGAELVRPFTHQRVCFHYHGSRIPPATVPNISFIQAKTQLLKYSVVSFLHRLAWKYVDVFIAPSRHVLEALTTEFNLGKRTLIVPNGVDTRQFANVTEEDQLRLRKTYHIPQHAFVCLLVTRMNADKGILQSLSFVKLLQENSRKQILLLLASPSAGNDEPYFHSIKKSLTRLEIPHYIFIDHPQLQELYQISDCFLSHSLREVFPLALLEASASGIPYFAAKNGTIEKYLEQIDPALILPESQLQAVRQVLATTHKKKLSENLRTFALRHTWQASAVQLVEELRSEAHD